MTKSRKSTAYIAWKSTHATISAFIQCAYSVFVLAIVSVTLFAAYVATLDEIPVPEFLLREIQENLKTKGVALQFEAMRLKPNGRISLDQPELFSSGLGATIAAADAAVVKINLTHLLIGRLTVDHVRLSNGSLFLPAMVSSSGLQETAVDSINLDAQISRGNLVFNYATLSIHNLDIYFSGRIKGRLLKTQPSEVEEQAPFSATQSILDIAPKINEIRTQFERFTNPICIIDLDIDEAREQTAHLELLIDKAQFTPKISASAIIAEMRYGETKGIETLVTLDSLSLPFEANATNLIARTSWNEIPSASNWLPETIDVSAKSLHRSEVFLQSIIARIHPSAEAYKARVQTSLGDTSFGIRVDYQLKSKETHFALEAEISPTMPSTLDPASSAMANILLSEQAMLGERIDISIKGSVDKDMKPIAIQAVAQSGSADIRGAKIDQSKVIANVIGPQIDVENIWLRSGMQSAELQIGYNLETLFRRVLVEGNVDPSMINGWFKPWWAAIWEGMSFPAEGMYAAMDSKAYFKQPETVVVTGIGHAENMNLRGIDTKDLRTRFFARFHYVDLYELELTTREDRFARGEIQFTMDRDHRDEKDKLSAMWIDAETNIDVRIGPEVLWEIADSVEEILEPYSFEIPPLIKARSQSIRKKDIYDYNIDLDISTRNSFNYHGLPFESLETFVHLENDIVDVPNAQARLGGGQIDVSAFIRGEDIELDVNLANADFGKTLVATNTYFAEGGSESAQKMDIQKLLNYEGFLNTNFNGRGIVGDTLSYTGTGSFRILDADFGKFQILGRLSQLLESTPLGFTTLAFREAKGSFEANKREIQFPNTSIDGPIAALKLEGSYSIETEGLDFKAKLFPFRNSKIPLISPLINVALQPVSTALEFVISGTFNQPKLSIFDGRSRNDEQTDTPRRDHRPSR